MESPKTPLDSMFARAQQLNPHLTRAEFDAKRAEALSRASSEPHVMTEVNGVLMSETLTAEERAELTEDNNMNSN